MSHFLVADKTEFSQYPCTLYASPTFRERLEFEEVNQTKKPDFLPEIPILQLGDIIDINSIMEFIGDEREEIYLSMIAAVLEYNNPENTSKKKILILDEEKNIVKWIAAIHYAFPVQYLDRLSFCTYVYSPVSTDFLINGVLPTGTSFVPDSADNSRYFHIFDCINRVWPELPTDQDLYKLLGLSLTLSYKNLEHFHEFLSRYNYSKVDKELYDAVSLYTIVNSQAREMKKEKIFGAVNFDSKYGTGKTKAGLFQGLLSSRNIIYEDDLASKQEICKLLIRTAVESEDSISFCPQAYAFFVNTLFLTLNTVGTDESYERAWSFYNDILSFDKTLNGSLDSYFHSYERVDEMVSRLDGEKNVYSNAFFLRWALIEINEKSASLDALKNNDWYSRLLDRIFENLGLISADMACQIMTITLPAMRKRQILLSFISRIISHFSQNNELKMHVWKIYTEIMKDSDSPGYDRAYDYFISHKQADLVYFLFQCQYERSPDKKEVFSHHVTRFVQSNSDYSRQYTGRIFSNRIDSINSTNHPDKIHDLKEIVDFITKIIPDASLKKDLILHVCSTLPVSKPGKESLVFFNTLITNFNDLNRYDISPKFYLINVGRVIDKERESGELAHKFKERLGLLSVPDIGDLPKKDKLDFSDWILPNLLWYVTTKENHQVIISILGGFIHDDMAFEKKYLEDLNKVVTQGLNNQHFSSFIEYCADNNKGIQSPFGHYIIDTLYNLSDSKRDLLIEEILQREQNNDKLKNYLKTISNTIRERKESTLLGRFKKILKK